MKKKVSIFIAVMLVFSCGPGFIYPHLDWLIPWYIDDYISLNSNQSSMLKSRLMQQLDWHCRTQLSAYAEYLRDIAADFEKSSVTYATLESHFARLLKHWRDLMRQIAPDVADILITATDGQIEELFSNLEKENQELRAEYLEPPAGELLEIRRKKMIKRLDYWISSLTLEQKQAAKDWNLQLQPISEEWLQNRERFQVDLRRLLDRRADADNFRQTLSDMLIYPERSRSAEYQKKLEYNTAVTLKFIIAVDRLMTPGQRKKLVQRLNDLAEDFDRLKCEPDNKTAAVY
ncbi:MAG: hypothetical protein JRF72_04725 [Deltaproteobacteria bacterium]|jgi:hypothetical protein|nr:hypothetical protein [Deltaproteobacteria bacterium]